MFHSPAKACTPLAYMLLLFLSLLTACMGSQDPRVEISASQRSLRIGETLTITVKDYQVEHPQYQFYIQDDAVGNFTRIAYVPYLPAQVSPEASKLLEFVSANWAENGGLIISFRALNPGTAQIYVTVSGLLHYADYPTTGAAHQGGIDSEKIQLTVVGP